MHARARPPPRASTVINRYPRAGPEVTATGGGRVNSRTAVSVGLRCAKARLTNVSFVWLANRLRVWICGL